jgi:hypothetical protein
MEQTRNVGCRMNCHTGHDQRDVIRRVLPTMVSVQLEQNRLFYKKTFEPRKLVAFLD